MSKGLGNNIGRDICKLADLLEKHGLARDPYPLNAAGEACIRQATEQSWSYKVHKLIFDVPQVQRMPIDAVDISVSFSLNIEGRLTNGDKVENPLNELLFEIEIEAWRENEIAGTVDQLYAAWHLDKHIVKPGDHKPKYSHPLYHIAFGGNRMEAWGQDRYGRTIILSAPRLLYPPMDAVLGVDFLLQNYLHKNDIANLLLESEYRELLRNSQERLWKPFYTSLYSHWDATINTVEESFGPLQLFPLYC